MGLLKLIRDSIYSPQFYRELAGKPFSFSLKYFYSLVVVIALVLTIVFSMEFIPQMNALVQSVIRAFTGSIPADVVVTIQRGMASINKKEPYAVPLPDEFRRTFKDIPDANSPEAENLFVVDTQSLLSLERFLEHKTVFWLTKNALVMGGRDELRVQSLQRVPGTVLDKAFLASVAAKLQPFLRWLPPLVVFGVFTVFVLLFSSTLVYLLVGAFVVWGVARARGARLTYGASYRLGLHAVTAALVVHAFQLLILPGVPFRMFIVYTAVLAVVVWCSVKGEKSAGENRPLPQGTS
jgi:hypothetical protein